MALIFIVVFKISILQFVEFLDCFYDFFIVLIVLILLDLSAAFNKLLATIIYLIFIYLITWLYNWLLFYYRD